MPRNDCGFVYTCVESIGLGMDLQRNESRSLCNLWGWLIRIFYACYLATRCAYYFAFTSDHGSGAADLVGMLLLDLNFLLAAVVNHRLSVGGHLVRNVASIYSQAGPGNPRVVFSKVLTFVAFLVWGVAIFSSIYQHEHVRAESSMERSLLVLSHYVNGIFVFGTFCFSMALFNYAVYCLCYALQEYRKKLSVLFSRQAKPTIMNLVLRDFCAIGGLIRDVSGAFRVVVLLWFAAGAVYAVEMAVNWALADRSLLTPSVLRVGAVTALLFLSSDVASRLHRQALGVRTTLDTVLDSLGVAANQEAYAVVDRFATDSFTDEAPAVRLLRRWCLGRVTFLAWLVAVAAVCGGAAAISHFAVS